ncbi:hypothetical protein SSCG_05454 [Streptomyces clavuligerus]|nr:hypothetical protein [Streptomyces clavuligerus]EDY52426.1 hypothetical protein SSCG_05454 [Streptomyces clavuligerus]
MEEKGRGEEKREGEKEKVKKPCPKKYNKGAKKNNRIKKQKNGKKETLKTSKIRAGKPVGEPTCPRAPPG